MNGEGLIIEIGDEPFEVTRYNTHLYTFLGNLATRNHIFVITEYDDEEARGAYVWQSFQRQEFDYLREHMEKHNYSQYLNLLEVSDMDEDAYERAIKRQVSNIGDFIPEDF